MSVTIQKIFGTELIPSKGVILEVFGNFSFSNTFQIKMSFARL